MSRLMTLLFLSVIAAIGVLTASCDRNKPAATENASMPAGAQPSPAPGEGALAVVNGVPITQADVTLASLRTGGHGTDAAPQDKAELLETIIQQELAYQRAVELGLDKDPAYQEQLAKGEAQINAFKRGRMWEALVLHEANNRAVVSDGEAQAYFENNTAHLRTEMHLWQILRQNENAIEQVSQDIAGGMTFEEAAGKGFPDLPGLDRKPWDLGYLKWSQLPEAWHAAIQGLAVGETSDIIRGPNNRFWIIKLVDKRENPGITFEDAKPNIMKILQREKQQGLEKELRQELRDKAHIVYGSEGSRQ